MIPQPDERNAIYMPLFSALKAIALGEYDDIRYFNTDTLFWSLTRLFGHYERIISAVDLSSTQRAFLASDLESFIIRFRVILNDVAYAVRLLLPQDVRGLSPPKGGTHEKNREMSIFTLTKFFAEKSVEYPEFSRTFTNALPWMTRLKDDRDNVIHYKAKVEVYEGLSLTFALANPAGTERKKIRPDGGKELELTPIGAFVDEQLMSLYRFMNDALVNAVELYSLRRCLKMSDRVAGFRISGPGIARFRVRNNLL